jgi:hypothetical protein
MNKKYMLTTLLLFVALCNAADDICNVTLTDSTDEEGKSRVVVMLDSEDCPTIQFYIPGEVPQQDKVALFFKNIIETRQLSGDYQVPLRAYNDGDTEAVNVVFNYKKPAKDKQQVVQSLQGSQEQAEDDLGSMYFCNIV